MPALPSSLALTSIADGSLMVASDERNNFTAIQTATNALIAALAGGAVGQTLRAVDATTVAWSNVGLSYRKTTAKTVNTTVAETDLLNAEITVGAGVLGTNGVLRLTARGDWKQNSGGAADIPRFKLKLGGTTLIDTGATGQALASNSANRERWALVATIANLGATNAQWIDFSLQLTNPSSPTASTVSAVQAFTTGEGAIAGVVGYAAGNPLHGFFDLSAGNTGAVDTTAACALVLTVINASANASYETVLKHALVEVV